MTSTNSPQSSRDRSLIERFLSLFAEVKAGEGKTVLLMFANIFLILFAYYVLKVVREALTIGGVELFGLPGDEVKAYLSAFMAFLLLGVIPAYGELASRVDRLQLIKITSSFVVVSLVGFWLWGRTAGVGTAIGISFYVWLGIVSVFLIAQFWSYANDIYTEKQGKRLFAIIAIGQSAGAILGPLLAKLGKNYFFELPLVCAGIFALCTFLYARADSAGAGGDEAAAAPSKPLSKEGGFRLVFSTRYLLLMAFMILTTNVVNTTGEFVLSNAAKTHSQERVPLTEEVTEKAIGHARAPLRDGKYDRLADLIGAERPEAEDAARPASLSDREAFAGSLLAKAAVGMEEDELLKDMRAPVIGLFYSDFFFWVNLVGLLIQAFLVSRIFKYFGIRAALFVLPIISLGGYASIGLLGGLVVLRIAKTAENATDYSLQNTVKQALFLPTSREAKYKAKAAIDTFFVRFGDAASATIVFVGIHALAFEARTFAFVNVGLAVVWILLCVGIAREHKKLEPDDNAGEAR